jgi:N6-L-threonylcarbamoyladenine synthase
VAANSGLRETLVDYGKKQNWQLYIPKRAYTTDNAAMIAITAWFKYLKHDFSTQDIVPDARFSFDL